MNAKAIAHIPTSGHQHANDAPVSLAVVFKALGDALRVQIVRLLKGDSLSVSELCDVFDMRQSALSHHLKVLVEAGVLVRRKEGTAVFYRRALPSGERIGLIETAFASIDSESLGLSVKNGLQRVQRQREQNSLTFFRSNSHRFRQQQDLIASWDDYSQAALHLLERCDNLATLPVLEIGPGDGRLLPLLATQAQQVVALDNAPEMLEDAKKMAGHLPNVEFWLGDTQALSGHEQAFSAAVINMVLHHTPNPDMVIAQAAQSLAPGGSLIISELIAHDQAWAREHCGDLWLGFEPEQLKEWGRAAGLENRAELFITQRNGFQVQVRLLQKNPY